MSDLDVWIEKLGRREGCYSNHRADYGGETFCGVARNRRGDWDGWAAVDAMKPEGRQLTFKTWGDVKAGEPGLYSLILKAAVGDYWWPSGAARLPEGGPWTGIKDLLGDGAFNQGPGFMAECLQKAVNALNKAGRICPNIPVDGAVGPKTVASLAAIMESDRQDPIYIMDALEFFRAIRYYGLAAANETQELNLRSWIRRKRGLV
jgi:lysozyme family protein